MIARLLNKIYRTLYTLYKKKKFAACGKITLMPRINVIGGQHIYIGDRVFVAKDCVLATWPKHNGLEFHPQIIIEDEVTIGEGAHITAINKIVISKGTLLGKYVTISDNSHGQSTFDELIIRPTKRCLFSKGPVVIEENVWIGDKATILPNIIIGKGSIIGAGAIVTKNVPPYSVVVGNPGKVIKTIH